MTTCCEAQPGSGRPPSRFMLSIPCEHGSVRTSGGDSEAKSGDILTLPPSPTRPITVPELKGALIVFRNECAANALRQEQMFLEMQEAQSACQQENVANASRQEKVFAELLQGQGACQEELVTLKKFQEELLGEVRKFSTSLDTLVTQGFANLCNPESDIPPITRLDDPTAGTGELKEGECADGGREQEYSGEASTAQPLEGLDRQNSLDTWELSTPSTSPTGKKMTKGASKLNFGEQNAEEEEVEDANNWRVRLDKKLRRKEFELFIACAIVANAGIMFLEGQYDGFAVGHDLRYPGREIHETDAWPGANVVFSLLDWLFGLAFLLECGLKLICWGFRYFRDYWNLLDFLCVLQFLFDKLLSDMVGFKPQMLRLLRLFRLARLVRLLRFLETLEYLYVMTTAIGGLTRVLSWACFLLLVLLISCDLFLVQLLQATYFDKVDASELSPDQLLKHQKMFEYFGTCTRCLLSMFELTLGNWPPVARLLTEEVSEWFTVFCLLHKLTIGFAVVGVITGVILQETFKVALTDDLIMLRQKKKASTVLRTKLQDFFLRMDEDGSGSLALSEFMSICDDPNIKMWLASLDIETDDLDTLFHLCDADGAGSIELDELVARMPRIRGAARSIDVLALSKKVDKLEGLTNSMSRAIKAKKA